jgi:hypothetical protein
LKNSKKNSNFFFLFFKKKTQTINNGNVTILQLKIIIQAQAQVFPIIEYKYK